MNGFVHPTEVVRDTAERIDGALEVATPAARAMVEALRALAAALPGTEVAGQATTLAAAWSADTTGWSRDARRLAAALEAGADDLAGAEQALASEFGR